MSDATTLSAGKETVGVIGAGSWGTTLAKVLAENGNPVLLWSRRPELADALNSQRENQLYLPKIELPESIRATSNLQEIAEQALLLLLVVPSHGLRKVAYELGEFVTGEHVVIHATKGLEQGSHKRMSEVLREETCLRKIGVLSGPNLARELAQGQPAGTLIASRYAEVYRRGHAALTNDYFRVYWNQDVIGAEVGGAFKNVIAVGGGVAAGLGLGENTKALLLTRGLSEMARLGAAMGADVMTFGGMAGIGDLMATCNSSLSRNHQVGRRLAAGETLDHIQSEMKMVAEGVKTARAVHQFCDETGVYLPIANAVYRLLYEEMSIPELLSDLMAVPTGAELDALQPHST